MSFVHRFAALPLLWAGAALLAPATAVAVEDVGGTYISLSGAYVIPLESDFSAGEYTGDFTMENSVGFLAAVGYDTGSGLQAEVEVGYRALDVDEITNQVDGGQRLPDISDVDTEVETLSVMLNGYYVFGQGQVKPYLGGGVGFARHAVSGEGVDDYDDSVLSYQAMAGVAFSLSESTEVRAGYRYFATADIEDDDGGKGSYGTHNVEAGLVFRF